MKVEIRQATSDDIADVLALYAQPDLDNGQVLSLEDAQAVFAQFARYPSYRLFVAVVSDPAVGDPVVAAPAVGDPVVAAPAVGDPVVAAPAVGVQVVGSYALLVMHNLAHRGTPSAIAEDVVVARAFQGRGIGRQMMEHAAAQARAAGCYKLALSSNHKRVQAHRFYASLGFQAHGVSFVMEP